MALSLAQKLRLTKGISLLTINAPQNFADAIDELPEGITISSKAKTYNQIHWFVKNRAEMEAEVEKVISLLKDDVVCWIYYPKGTSKVQIDLTRDKGWESLLAHNELQWISLISFNDTWSTFGMRLKNEADKKKELAPAKEREIFKYIDAAKKTIILPDDLAEALSSDTDASLFFEKLSFTNKKEYVEWIITAKREKTRKERVTGTIERLHKQWKNPRNM